MLKISQIAPRVSVDGSYAIAANAFLRDWLKGHVTVFQPTRSSTNRRLARKRAFSRACDRLHGIASVSDTFIELLLLVLIDAASVN